MPTTLPLHSRTNIALQEAKPEGASDRVGVLLAVAERVAYLAVFVGIGLALAAWWG